MSDTHFTKSPLAVELDAGTHHACACGKSANFPFCDGSHKGSGIAPRKFELSEKKTVYMCRCGQSGNAPFCDGTHKKA